MKLSRDTLKLFKPNWFQVIDLGSVPNLLIVHSPGNGRIQIPDSLSESSKEEGIADNAEF